MTQVNVPISDVALSVAESYRVRTESRLIPRQTVILHIERREGPEEWVEITALELFPSEARALALALLTWSR